MPTYWLSDSQSRRIHHSSLFARNYDANTRSLEIGVAFCSGGFFFLIFGLILFFDRALLAMGNILFLVGVTMLLGPQRTFLFFARKQKWRGSAAFWAGILLILLRWTLIGFAVECYGIFVLFGEFFKTIAGFAYNIPVIGPYLSRALQVAGDKAGANERAHKDLPV
ncbi:hypothetical protein KC349_g7129 [Hortaea werneckii]|nr:hypothetical protein KC349_g7129 [Hortaea werneckii]